MRSTKVKLIAPVLTGTLIVSGYTGIKYKLLEKEMNTVEDAIKGAMDIIAEQISDNAEYRKQIKKIAIFLMKQQ